MAKLDCLFIEIGAGRFPHFESADSEIKSANRPPVSERGEHVVPRNFSDQMAKLDRLFIEIEVGRFRTWNRPIRR